MQAVIRPLIATLVLLNSSALAIAQESSWAPSQSVRMIVPFQAGGPIDTIARLVAQQLSEKWGQPFIVENRTGAGGNLGSDAVAKAPADGYTLGLASGGTHGANVTLFGKRMPYDPVKDFAPVTMLARMKNVLLVHPSLKVNTLKEFIAKAEEKPDQPLSFGSAGTGTVQHLTAEMFKVATGLNLVHVTYRGQAQAIPDLLNGRIAMMFVGAGEAAGHVQSGALIPIGLSTGERSSVLPEVVPLSEQGLKDFDAVTWFGLVAPAGTPNEIIEAYKKAVTATLQQPDVKGRLEKIGLEIRTTSPAEFHEFIASEVQKWGNVIKAGGISID